MAAGRHHPGPRARPLLPLSLHRLRACNGAWVLYQDGRYKEPVGEYLDGSMYAVEQQYGRALKPTDTLAPL